MNLISFSINHKTAPIEVREKIWFSEEETRIGLRRLQDLYFRECLLFSTCNRTEVYGFDPKREIPGGEVRRTLIGFKGALGSVSPEHFLSFVSDEAVAHLFSVAGGIDSMVVGDIQILNQVKEGYKLAREEQAVGPVLNRLLQTALRVGKRARSETGISDGAVSVSYAAVELASKIFEDLQSKSALLIGAGKTGELTIKHLLGKGIGRLRIANRTRVRAVELCDRLGGEIVEFERLTGALATVDIVITSIGGSTLLSLQDVQKAMKARMHKPLFLIDLGVPRNIDPMSRKVENVFLYDLDSLAGLVDRNLGKRKDEIPRVEKIVHEEHESFMNWYRSIQVGPTIQELREAVEAIRLSEIDKNINRFRTEDRELLELVTKRIVNKILHHPITTLKHQIDNGSPKGEISDRISSLREIFGLRGEDRSNED